MSPSSSQSAATLGARPRAASRRRAVGCALPLVIAALAACSDDDFDPITRITEPRVLAVVSEPTVLAIDGEVHLDALTVDALGPRGPGRPVSATRMRACTPWKFLSNPDVDCLGADALALAPDETGRFALSTEDLLAAFPPPDGAPATAAALRLALAAGLELRIPIVVEVDVDGYALVARRDLWVVEEVGELQNPRATGLRFDGASPATLRAGTRYRLTIAFDRDSLDPSQRGDSDRPPRLEELDCNFYSPAGELAEREVDVEDPEADAPESAPNAYTAGAPGQTWIYVVATDESGGMSLHTTAVTVE